MVAACSHVLAFAILTTVSQRMTDQTATVGEDGVTATTSVPAPFRVSRAYQLTRQALVVASAAHQAAEAAADCAAINTGPSSVVVLAATLTCALMLAVRPALILPALLLAALRHMAWAYFYRVRCKGQPHTLDEEWRAMTARVAAAETAASAETALNPTPVAKKKNAAVALVSALSAVNPLNLVKRKETATTVEGANEHSDVQAVDRLLRPHLNAALKLVGVQCDDGADSLTWYQHSWERALAAVESLDDALNWRSAHSSQLAGSLGSALIYCWVGSQLSLVILSGTALLAHETVFGKYVSVGLVAVLNPAPGSDKAPLRRALGIVLH